jgi:hypothetical protein
MKKIILLTTCLLFLICSSTFAMKELTTDEDIQAVIDEGLKLSQPNEGYKMTVDIGKYKVRSYLLTPSILIKNKALDQKVKMYNYTVQDAKQDFIDGKTLRIDFDIAAHFTGFGKSPNINFAEICSFMILQGDKVIRPSSIESKSNIPRIDSSMFGGTWLVGSTATYWDMTSIDLTAPITLRCVIETKSADIKYNLPDLQ